MLELRQAVSPFHPHSPQYPIQPVPFVCNQSSPSLNSVMANNGGSFLGTIPVLFYLLQVITIIQVQHYMNTTTGWMSVDEVAGSVALSDEISIESLVEHNGYNFQVQTCRT